MPTKRRRGESVWEYVVNRKGLLPRPLYLHFDSEREGDASVARLEALLDRGIVPPELIAGRSHAKTIGEAIRQYLGAVSVPASDRTLLNLLLERIGDVQLRLVTSAWAEDWVKGMKRERVLAPSTIRHYVGALGRCLDWVVRRAAGELVSNPIPSLPKRYATYNEADVGALRAREVVSPRDQERDRRLHEDDEPRIRAILAGKKVEGRERGFALKWQGALEAVFELALETAMRLREIYMLELEQVDVRKRTIFLTRTKNGDKRQVPMTSIAVQIVTRYLEQIKAQTRGMKGYSVKQGRLFPWWDGRDDSLNATTALLSRPFARVFEAAECEDFTSRSSIWRRASAGQGFQHLTTARPRTRAFV